MCTFTCGQCVCMCVCVCVFVSVFGVCVFFVCVCLCVFACFLFKHTKTCVCVCLCVSAGVNLCMGAFLNLKIPLNSRTPPFDKEEYTCMVEGQNPTNFYK